MLVSSKLCAHSVQEQLIIDLTDHVARLVQLSQDAGMRSFHQVTDDLVVEVVHLPTHRLAHRLHNNYTHNRNTSVL